MITKDVGLIKENNWNAVHVAEKVYMNELKHMPETIDGLEKKKDALRGELAQTIEDAGPVYEAALSTLVSRLRTLALKGAVDIARPDISFYHVHGLFALGLMVGLFYFNTADSFFLALIKGVVGIFYSAIFFRKAIEAIKAWRTFHKNVYFESEEYIPHTFEETVGKRLYHGGFALLIVLGLRHPVLLFFSFILLAVHLYRKYQFYTHLVEKEINEGGVSVHRGLFRPNAEEPSGAILSDIDGGNCSVWSEAKLDDLGFHHRFFDYPVLILMIGERVCYHELIFGGKRMAAGSIYSPLMRLARSHIYSHPLATLDSVKEYLWGVKDVAAYQEQIDAIDSKIASLQDEVALAKIRAQAWDGFYVPEEVLKKFLVYISLFKKGGEAAPSGILFQGPPGTGKTEFVRRAAKASGCNIVFVGASDLKAAHVGGTEERVREVWKEVRSKLPCILFVDECDAVFPDRASNADQFAKSLTNGFLHEWGGMQGSSGVLVVGATNYPQGIDGAILSRFGEIISIGLPDKDARLGMMTDLFRRFSIDSDVTEDMVKCTTGFSGRDLNNVVKQMLIAKATYPDNEWNSHFTSVVNTMRKRTSTSVNEASTWESLVLPKDLLEELAILSHMVKNPDILQSQGLAFPKTWLFKGPPGTGKTEIARTLANESGVAFISLTASDLKGSHVGETAPKVQAAFERVRSQSPAIMFIDEIDTVIPKKGLGDQFSEEALGVILQELDGAKNDSRSFVLIAATNNPENLDAAFLSRMEEEIEVGLPDCNARKEILRRKLKGKPLGFDLSDQFLYTVAERLEGSSGRDIMAIVKRAERRAVKRASSLKQLDRIIMLPEDFA